MTALQCGIHQIDLQSRDLPLLQKGHGIVIRGHAACDPAGDKSRGIKQRAQIRLSLGGVEGVEAGEVGGARSPVRKGSTAEIVADILKRWPYRIDALPLDEGHGVIEIIDTIKRRKTPDGELAI